jgi:hypothetical protein
MMAPASLRMGRAYLELPPPPNHWKRWTTLFHGRAAREVIPLAAIRTKSSRALPTRQGFRGSDFETPLWGRRQTATVSRLHLQPLPRCPFDHNEHEFHWTGP